MLYTGTVSAAKAKDLQLAIFILTSRNGSNFSCAYVETYNDGCFVDVHKYVCFCCLIPQPLKRLLFIFGSFSLLITLSCAIVFFLLPTVSLSSSSLCHFRIAIGILLSLYSSFLVRHFDVRSNRIPD